MRITQYTCFVISCAGISAKLIDERLEIVGAELEEAGSRGSEPKRPSMSSWSLYCRTRGADIGDQVDELLSLLEPSRDAIKRLVLEDEAETVLQLVRYFNDGDGEQEILDVTEEGLEKLPGQHQLLGWGFSHGVIEFLHDVHAVVDADEYG